MPSVASPAIFFYISGHGFGHSIRQIEIIEALLSRQRPLRIVVRTSAVPRLFTRALDDAVEFLPAEVDTGVVQVDSLRLDPAATMTNAAAFYGGLSRRVEDERALLERHRAVLVVTDAPPLACASARAAGVPSIVCGNFTWDWIYRDYADASPDAPAVIDQIAALYADAAAGWRLPMHGGFETVPAIRDVPFVARHSTGGDADTIRRTLSLPCDIQLALVSFGGYGVHGLALEALDCAGSWRAVVTAKEIPERLPPGVVVVKEDEIYRRGLRYEDLVRAVDVVISKPGYGIISDCVANGRPLLFTSRGRFAEYDVMLHEMPRFLRCRQIAMDDFLAGRWREALEALAGSPAPPEQPSTDGARVVANLILERIDA